MTTVLWRLLSLRLAAYINSRLSFIQVYDALATAVTLPLWANASGIALFLGLACCAQLEAYRAGGCCPCEPDIWQPPIAPSPRSAD